MPFPEAEVVRSRLKEETASPAGEPGDSAAQPKAEPWTCSRWAVKLPYPVKPKTVSEQSSRYGRRGS